MRQRQQGCRGCYAGLEWSGHWLATATGDEDGSEIIAGMAGVRRRIGGDSTLDSAWMFLGAYDGGVDGAANSANRWLQRSLCPPVPDNFPWVFYNSWDAYHADIDEALLRREAERTTQFHPKDLNPDAIYAVPADGIDASMLTGRALAADGVTVRLDAPNESTRMWLERRLASGE